MKILFPLLTAFLFLTLPVIADSKVSGKIVNINTELKVAFTDLVPQQVLAGDVVEIYQADTFLTYLEVLETTETVSKLGFVKKSGLATSLDGFNKIAVGCRVVRLPESALPSYDAVLSKLHNAAEKNAQLLAAQTNQQKEIDSLKKQNDAQLDHLKLLSDKLLSFQKTLTHVDSYLDRQIQHEESIKK